MARIIARNKRGPRTPTAGILVAMLLLSTFMTFLLVAACNKQRRSLDPLALLKHLKHVFEYNYSLPFSWGRRLQLNGVEGLAPPSCFMDPRQRITCHFKAQVIRFEILRLVSQSKIRLNGVRILA